MEVMWLEILFCGVFCLSRFGLTHNLRKLTESRLPLSFFVKGRNNCLSLLECGSWCLEYATAATGEAGEEGGGLGGQDSESHRP